MLLLVLTAISIIPQLHAECINACSGHGSCTVRDMCDCYRNFMGADCSERVCPFGFAYVDTPKGDLDSSGTVDSYLNVVGYQSQMYPFGTTEEWPRMQNTRFHLIENTAHWYMECSNSGTCNRKTGDCECLPHFWGATCQRQHCPGYPDNECSGHGQCLTVQAISKLDHGNVYDLWDKTVTHGCQCEYGYSGGACEIRECKKDVDPMYADDIQKAKYATYNLGIFTTSKTMDFTDGKPQPGPAQLQLRFYDQYNKPWLTDVLPVGFNCQSLVQVLEGIPNHVIPSNSVNCVQTHISYGDPENSTDIRNQFTYNYLSTYTFINGMKPEAFQYKPVFWDAGFRNSYDLNDTTVRGNITGDIYRIEFTNNPGNVLPIEVETFLGQTIQPSVVSKGQTIFRSWTNGEQGEEYDYFANHCNGVTVQVGHIGTLSYLTGFTSTEKSLLKACLGGSDFDLSNNVEVYNWDYGSITYPHIIRLLRSSDGFDNGDLVTLYYDTSIMLDNLQSEGTFRLMQPYRSDLLTDDQNSQYDVYTTTGVLYITSFNTAVTFDFASNLLFSYNTTSPGSDLWHGDMSCDVTNPGELDFDSNDNNKMNYLNFCLKKEDIIILMDPTNPAYNPAYTNMYTIKRLFNTQIGQKFHDTPYGKYFYGADGSVAPKAGYLYGYDNYNQPIIVTDLTTNWATSITGAAKMRVYKFNPVRNSTYHVVNTCSNRGICNTYDGLCDCFPGYTGDACTVQNALAV